MALPTTCACLCLCKGCLINLELLCLPTLHNITFKGVQLVVNKIFHLLALVTQSGVLPYASTNKGDDGCGVLTPLVIVPSLVLICAFGRVHQMVIVLESFQIFVLN